MNPMENMKKKNLYIESTTVNMCVCVHVLDPICVCQAQESLITIILYIVWTRAYQMNFQSINGAQQTTQINLRLIFFYTVI